MMCTKSKIYQFNDQYYILSCETQIHFWLAKLKINELDQWVKSYVWFNSLIFSCERRFGFNFENKWMNHKIK